MRLRFNFPAAALILLVFCLSSAAASAKDQWLKVRSKNFQLIGNAAEIDIRQVATKLEQFREVFRRIFPKFNFESTVPTSVVVFSDEQFFRNYKPLNAGGQPNDWVAGFFQKGDDANYMALSCENIKQGNYQTIFHEYVHFLINNDIGRSNVPPWFNEGLAEYYEQFSIENDRRVKLGGLNAAHLKLLQQYPLIPLDKFFNTDYYTLQQQGRDGAGLFYAQAWALMHYIMLGGSGGDEKNAQLNVFIDLLLTGKPAREAFEQAFQTDYAAMETELKKYIAQKSFQSSVTVLSEKLVFNSEMQTSPVSEADAKAILGDLLFHIKRTDDAETQLKEALALNPDSSLANASLGLIKAQQNKFSEAKTYLEKAVNLDETNYLVYFQYAYAMSRDGMTDSGFVNEYSIDQADKMRAALARAIALNPGFSESYALYAFIGIVRNERIDEAVSYLDKALKIAPGNQWYQLRSAELFMRKEDFSDARRIAVKVSQTASEDDLRLYARNTVALVNSLEAQLESIKRQNEHDRAQNITDKPLPDDEIARLREKAILESINEILRRPRINEKRVLGVLSKIECGGGSISYTVRVDDQVLKLSSPDFNSVDLMSYNADMVGAKIGCDASPKESSALITYRPNTDQKAKTAGELIAIEFVPAKFRLLY